MVAGEPAEVDDPLDALARAAQLAASSTSPCRISIPPAASRSPRGLAHEGAHLGARVDEGLG
jgi:hypothetical protein